MHNHKHKVQNYTVIAVVVALLHIVGWGILFSSNSAITIGTGLIAYALGLKHAFDPDHIVAIDNTTRNLLNQKKSALKVGLFFSLGHSSVVFLATLLIAFGAASITKALIDNPILPLIGGTVAGTFLVVIGLLNTVNFVRILQKQIHDHQTVMYHLLKPLMKSIDAAWKIYPVGFLFGLGFDTASSIALLALSATSALTASPLAILALPLIFAAGMSLGDAIDGVAMYKLYDWANTPDRRHIYNLALTALSALAAYYVGINILIGL